jgi:hypothetical protein
VIDEKVPGFQRWLETAAGQVPQIDCVLRAADHLGAWKARWGINRMQYLVPPGLYAIGAPNADAPVLVTANYKMSYDLVRRALAGRNVWLLVLETFGINVWCAAGKGTFGTGELVRRIAQSGLASVVSHRRVTLPMLGAPGVAAHEVKRRSGFTVGYGPIRAEDLPDFLDRNEQVTPEMRRVSFTFYERLVLVPVEIVLVLKSLALTGAVLSAGAFALAGQGAALGVLAAYLGAVFTGIALAPVLLPWLPGRSFAVKGALAGLAFSVLFFGAAGGAHWSLPIRIACFLTLPAVSAFYTLNFTGCTTYTSRSGVRKEMRLSLPAMAAALLVSLVLVLGAQLL